MVLHLKQNIIDTTHHKILKGSGNWYYHKAKEDHEYTK